MITLTRQQELAIEAIKRKLAEKQKIITIAGFAGTGKTTLVNYIIESLGYRQQDVAFAAFTGKASLVLQQKGIPATTLHSLLYTSILRPDGGFWHIPKKELEQPYKLIVIDEISMVSADILRHAVVHAIPIIALGDVGQLPPIGEGNGLLNSPDVILTEILRQEKENPIIQLSMDVREGKPLVPQKNDKLIIIDKKDLVDGMLTWADQIICGYNETRNNLNKHMRTSLGFTESIPGRGEKVICLKNYWEEVSNNNNPLINGMIGTIQSLHIATDKSIQVDFKPDFGNEIFKKISLDLNPFLGRPHEPVSSKKYSKKKVIQPLNFDYGYAITCHKSQGSSYEKVIVFEEKINRANHSKWLYTAITRASDKLIIVRDN